MKTGFAAIFPIIAASSRTSKLTSWGMCDCQILVPFDEEELSPKREALLARFEQQEREWESADEPN